MWMKKAPSARKMHNEKSLEVNEKLINPNPHVMRVLAAPPLLLHTN